MRPTVVQRLVWTILLYIRQQLFSDFGCHSVIQASDLHQLAFPNEGCGRAAALTRSLSSETFVRVSSSGRSFGPTPILMNMLTICGGGRCQRSDVSLSFCFGCCLFSLDWRYCADNSLQEIFSPGFSDSVWSEVKHLSAEESNSLIHALFTQQVITEKGK